MGKKVFITGASGFIGTNLVIELLERGFEICNFDLRAPLVAAHQEYWCAGDLMKPADLEKAVADYQPEWVIHLAARTECDETTTVEEGYRMNTDGTANLLAAVKGCPSVERLMITSSQFVCGPGKLPESDHDYFPETVYGESKVITERLTRAAELEMPWVIIRPTNIWGPYHERYCREFWKVASKGLYLHPDVPAPTRTYGYIGNVVWQMIALLEAPAEQVDRKVFYVSDRPIRIDKWSLGFAEALSGKRPPKLPLVMVKGLALVGDGISKFTGKPFFLTSSRLRSMTLDYLAPVEPTFELLGEAPWSLDQGIARTAEWFKEEHAKS